MKAIFEKQQQAQRTDNFNAFLETINTANSTNIINSNPIDTSGLTMENQADNNHAVDNKCIAITAGGTRCKKPRGHNSEYCSLHTKSELNTSNVI